VAIGWFKPDHLPADLYAGHALRIADVFRVWHGDRRAHFDH
jgi:hypothetical protein